MPTKNLSIDSDAVHQKAISLHQSGKPREAALLYERLLAKNPKDPSLMTEYGHIAFQLGHIEAAINILGRSLAVAHNQPMVLLIRGISFGMLKRPIEALADFDRAIALKPDYVEAYSNRGIVLYDLGRYDEALASYDQALELAPAHYQTYSNRGNVLKALTRFEDAITSYNNALTLNRNYYQAYNNKGSALNELSRFDEALASYKQAININPGFAEAYYNRGITLHRIKAFDAALASYDQAIAINPAYAEAYGNRGITLKELKRFDEALASLDRAIALKPDFAEAYSNRGITLKELKRFDEALASLDRAIALKPDFAEAYSNRGITLKELKRFDEALASLDRAIALKPDFAEAYNNRGHIYQNLHHYNEACASFKTSFSLNPGLDYLLGSMLHAKMHLCDWRDFDLLHSRLIAAIAANQKVSNPFPVLALTGNPDVQKSSSEVYATEYALNIDRRLTCPKQPRSGRICIGYFSADFHNHATMHLMAQLFELHDRDKFKLIAFSFGPDSNDKWRERAKNAFDQFIDVRLMSDKDVAILARSLQIDIAVDLKGYTGDSRTGIFAAQAAPIQVNYLGYPGTMATDYMDYIVADKTIIPVDKQPFYSEKVVYLPNSYQVNDTTQPPSCKTFTRAEAGLPERGFVFCSFNNNYKILPDVFDVWMRLLHRVEDSYLWLFVDNPTARDNLRSEAVKRGIDGGRLVFADHLPREEHLARIRLADLFLDTFPCNAHTTASDALRSGLPLLTYAGEAFASRVAASLLNAIGLPELIAGSLADYEALAFELATRPEELARIRGKLLNNLSTAPLYDTLSFTKHLETAYAEMYERNQNDQAPDHIDVAPLHGIDSSGPLCATE